jgi:hypothetical protein
LGAADAGSGAGAGAASGGEAGSAAPEWLGGLPDELRGDATLSRYKDVEALARGHIEARRIASSKLAVPAADAPAEAWNAVFDQLGRPDSPDKYDIPLPQGQEASPVADAFRPIAHQLGLLPGQAKGLAEFWNGQMDATQAAYFAKGEEEIGALKSELGADYEAKKAAAKATYLKLGLPPEFADELDQKVGSGALMRGFIKLAEATGEHRRVDGDGEAGLGAGLENAEAQLTALYADKSWREKLNAGDSVAAAQQKRLLDAAKAQATRQR